MTRGKKKTRRITAIKTIGIHPGSPPDRINGKGPIRMTPMKFALTPLNIMRAKPARIRMMAARRDLKPR